jgi:hypothetical protein
MVGIQAVKAARNQALWREVNERIGAVAETSRHMEFLCECADLDCTETLNLTVAEYERIRSSPVRFPIAIGHDSPRSRMSWKRTNVTGSCRSEACRPRRLRGSTPVHQAKCVTAWGLTGEEKQDAAERLRLQRVDIEALPQTPSKGNPAERA